MKVISAVAPKAPDLRSYPAHALFGLRKYLVRKRSDGPLELNRIGNNIHIDTAPWPRDTATADGRDLSHLPVRRDTRPGLAHTPAVVARRSSQRTLRLA